MLSACIVVKKGILREGDNFVCGAGEGKIKKMVDDHGLEVTEAYPGHSVTVTGFKEQPEPGLPMHVVRSPEEAKFIL